MRRRIPLVSLLLASLCSLAPSALASPLQSDAPDTAVTPELVAEVTPTTEADGGWWQSFNDGANSTFGTVNGFLAGYIFYDLFHTTPQASRRIGLYLYERLKDIVR